MKKIVNFIFYIGFLFFGGGFLIAFGQFVLYNGMGNLFEYLPSDKSIIEKKTDRMPNQLIYKYYIDDVEYTGSQNISSVIISDINIDSTIVLYNKYLKNYSMIQGISGRSSKSWDNSVGMVIMGFFFTFIFLIYKFANMNKWIGIYTKGNYKIGRNN